MNWVKWLSLLYTVIFHHVYLSIFLSLFRGGSRIFFRRGCTRLLLYFNTNKPHSSFFFCRIPVALENRRSSQGGVRTPCTLPLDPPLLLQIVFIQDLANVMNVYVTRSLSLVIGSWCSIRIGQEKPSAFTLKIHHVHILDDNAPCLPPKILCKHCLQYLLGWL